MNAVAPASFVDYKVADITLADFGRREITLADRINGCFRRSMNGKPLVVDAPEMQAMIAFFDWMKGETKPQDKVEGRGRVYRLPAA